LFREHVVKEAKYFFKDNVSKLMEKDPVVGPSSLVISSCISLALCIINRVLKRYSETVAEGDGTKGSGPSVRAGAPETRILCTVAAKDSPSDYVQLMNCAFSAQRLGVVIDAFILSDVDSTFLQQATHIAGGLYMRPEPSVVEQPSAMVNYLIYSFLPANSMRSVLRLPARREVDFRACCFATRRVISQGYTCSVCLSTFSDPREVYELEHADTGRT